MGLAYGPRLLQTVQVTIRPVHTCLTLAAVICVSAAGQRRTVLRTYAGTDGRAHIVLQDGNEYVAPKEGSAATGDQQQDVEALKVSEDGRAAGWLVLLPSCCTSYPIPLTLMVYRDGKLLQGLPVEVLRPVVQWHFWKGSAQVALLYQNLHGPPEFEAELYDLTSSKVQGKWSQPKHANDRLVGLPTWAQAFQQYMQRSL